MKDTEREEIARLWYDLDELNNLFEECTKDEFITRVFKGRVNDDFISFEGNEVIIGGNLEWNQIQALYALCQKLHKEMRIEAGKGEDGYPHLWTTIKDPE